MATSLSEIARMLDSEGVNYHRTSNFIAMGWGTGKYKDSSNEKSIMIVIRLSENGEYFKAFAPEAFTIGEAYRDPFLRACAIIQWKTKLIQFEYDENDGEVRPIIEFPLEDSSLTQRQLMRCVSGMVQLIDQFYPVLRRASETGVVDFPDRDETRSELLGRVLGALPDDQVADILKKSDEYRGN